MQLISNTGSLILSGFVDRRNDRGDTNSTEIALELASWTAQAVDCSVQVEGFQLSDLTFATACQSLCNQTGVRVGFGPGVNAAEVMQKIQINPGETAVGVIEKLCRKRGYSLTDRPDGSLLVVAGPLGGSGFLRLPGNISAYEANGNLRDQYSECLVLGSQASLVEGDTDQTLRVAGSASLPLSLDRPLIIQAKGEVSNAYATARAEHELKRRMARSLALRVTCPALRLVEVGMEVRTYVEPIGIDALMLVDSVRWSFDKDQGEQTEISLVDPASFSAPPPEPQPRPTPELETTQRSYVLDGTADE